VGKQDGALEGVAVNREFWRGKKVLVTGHTGFKGSWLCLWLQKLGAEVAGYALPPPAGNSLFQLASVGSRMDSTFSDIRDPQLLDSCFERFQPDIVFHLAAQSLVRASYERPVETYEVNVMGTVNVLETARNNPRCRAVVIVTSDKCYENKEWTWGYRENDPMGGNDPYSSSKGCAELVTAAYRHSFFDTRNKRCSAVASARAGNVIGGGDFSKDRIVPDFISAALTGQALRVRNPDAIRPWQHVLEPLSGYLLLAEKLCDNPTKYAQGWNFGPAADDVRSVRYIVQRLNDYYDGRVSWEMDSAPQPHEATLLTLDSAKARISLGWEPRWTLDQALQAVASWHIAHESGAPLRDQVLKQIAAYEAVDKSPGPRTSVSRPEALIAS
jgi:CDP-glucose 4,6-dehydratase